MSDAREFLAELWALAPGDEARADLVALLRGFDGLRLRVNVAEVERLRRRAQAAEMLARQVPRPAVVRHLVSAYGVSAATARRDVAGASRKAAQARP